MRPKAKIAPEVHHGPAAKGPPGKPPPKDLVSAAKVAGQKKPPPVCIVLLVFLMFAYWNFNQIVPKGNDNKVVPVMEPMNPLVSEPVMTPRSLYLQHAQETLNKANSTEDAASLINKLLNSRTAPPTPMFQRTQENEKKMHEEELRRLTQSYEETQTKHEEM